ncbi:class I SAM-dependent methyltransferase [Crateriforma conspicua]|uniref:Putative S-adenosylmethionine-dependent methyltransferase n=1 Tax=Crateriforma conspicua TaxID=2527996 RepID=A0A5C5Y2P9_9PLAN|nr:class I SAM-dependent methyltransferase [Crateriforma conspicua]QDV64607.1 putative S-adenosylmethionine-dependent methyltransferase/MSMEI_2290 [Crateriforma conspicua]TWT70006.1 putative S-adenosylmethionine-dependent methyltransferase [Crateriforma conspicua]
MSEENATLDAYRSDLAHIHDVGFGRFAGAAARTVVDHLRARDVRCGLVVDIGCGGGIAARIFADAGYQVLGCDVSGASVGIARERVPEASFQVGSYVDLVVPPAVAVVTIGEVLNYVFDPRCDRSARQAFFRRLFRSLLPGGLFLLDVAGPSRAPRQPTRTFAEGDHWAVLVETAFELDLLTRQITTFVREGAFYRRDTETHRLRLYPAVEVVDDLQQAGFDVVQVDCYADVPLLDGMHGFLATKAAAGSPM